MSSPEFRSFPIKPTDYYAAQEQVQRGEAATIEKAHQQNASRQITEQAPTANLVRLKAEQEKLAAKQAELDAKQAAEVALVKDWNTRVSDLGRARNRLEIGLQQRAQFDGDVQGRLEYIHTADWGVGEMGHTHPAIIMNHYTMLMAAERAVSDFPNWEKARRAEIAALETELEAFRVKNGITPGQ